ncbi:MAG: NAD(P)-binding protein [Clostridiales Family XIII bacterium]|jgi:Fe-S oxidoreductase|nr:NAD(P)-binding protein [Clostridiales Family XIII bacterium]
MLEEKNRIQRECLEKEPPFCTAACPFNLDILDFTAKIARGNFTAAYRAYRDQVAFPDIVSRLCGAPCRSVCPRRESDEAIRLSDLEKAAVSFTQRKEPNNYNLPSKRQRVAIVGAGPCGLSCALRFASNNYEVTVFDRADRIGGKLWDLLPPEIFLRDIGQSFAKARYTLITGRRIGELSEIDADAIFIATGKDGASFGLRPETGVTPTKRPGVFLGGMLCGSDPAEAIADGMKAFTHIEQYLKTSSMPITQNPQETRAFVDPIRLGQTSAGPSARGNFPKADAVAEAKRCLRCQCDSCKLRCDLMQYYSKTPPKIADDIYATVHPNSLFGGDTFAKRMIGTCNLCGACKDACPVDLDLGNYVLEGRRALQNMKKWSWAYHDFWIADMRHAMGEHAREVRFAPGRNVCKTVFFPGCQLGASDPDYVLESYAWLLERDADTALCLSCCGAPAFWAGLDEEFETARKSLEQDLASLGNPIVITACPTCTKMFARLFPGMATRSLVSLIADAGFKPERAVNGDIYAVYDPCAARNDDDLPRAVRGLAADAGYVTEELSRAKSNPGCCGWGGHVSIANPDFAKFRIDRLIAQSPFPYIAYCANCRDILAKAGKPALHILDVIFDLGEADRVAPGWSDRRKNRERLKSKLGQGFGGEGNARPDPNAPLILSEALRARISDDHILEDDVLETVSFCEAGGRTVTIPETGEKCGFHMIGNLTIWVSYIPEDGGFRVTRVYGHRMRIVLEGMWNGRRVDPDL